MLDDLLQLRAMSHLADKDARLKTIGRNIIAFIKSLSFSSPYRTECVCNNERGTKCNNKRNSCNFVPSSCTTLERK